MTNINCSANCNHEKNGKCTLNHVSISANIMGYGTDCAYYNPRNGANSSTPPQSNETK